MIGDLAEFGRTGMVCRRAAELDVPVEAWRAAVRHAGRLHGARVRTFVVPPTVAEARDQLVFAVRTDPPPDPAVSSQGLLRWWRLDELGMPLPRWRATMHRIARREGVRVHTFVAPATRAGQGVDPGPLVYALWLDPTDPRQSPLAAPSMTLPRARMELHPDAEPPAVTNLADYAAARRSTSIARHPSQQDDPANDVGDLHR